MLKDNNTFLPCLRPGKNLVEFFDPVGIFIYIWLDLLQYIHIAGDSFLMTHHQVNFNWTIFLCDIYKKFSLMYSVKHIMWCERGEHLTLNRAAI